MSLRRSPRRAPAKEDGAGADTDLSCRLAGSGSLADALLGLSSLTLMLATWFLGVFFPIVLAGLYYLRWNVAFGILLAAVAASYAMDFQQSPGFVTFILKISYWFKHATMHVEPEVGWTETEQTLASSDSHSKTV